MDEFIKDFIEEAFDIETINKYEFRTVCGFTFVFESEITTMHNHIPSASIRPVAIIYEENDQYYLAPLDEPIKINEIVKDFVENIL